MGNEQKITSKVGRVVSLKIKLLFFDFIYYFHIDTLKIYHLLFILNAKQYNFISIRFQKIQWKAFEYFVSEFYFFLLFRFHSKVLHFFFNTFF